MQIVSRIGIEGASREANDSMQAPWWRAAGRASRLVGAAVVAAVFARPAPAQDPEFHDGFEGSSLDAYWTPFSNSGVVTVPSSVQVHGGAQSLQLDTTHAGSNMAAGVLHSFSSPQYGRLSAWLYDSGADVSSSNYLTLWAPPFGVGTMDYDLGSGSGDRYVCTVGSLSFDTTVDRTVGWHHFTIVAMPKAIDIFIDGVSVYADSIGSLQFSDVQLEMHAPAFRPSWESYWDDFHFCPPATWSNYGAGFPGTAGVPRFTSRDDPVLGSTITLDLENSSGHYTWGFLFVGFQDASFATNRGGDLLVDPAWIIPLPMNPTGNTLVGILPADADYCGSDLYLQVLEIDAGAANGVSFTEGMRLSLGD